jgi:hypothetical protein
MVMAEVAWLLMVFVPSLSLRLMLMLMDLEVSRRQVYVVLMATWRLWIDVVLDNYALFDLPGVSPP